FAATELDHCLNFVTRFQETLCLRNFSLVIVVFNLQTEANFLQLCSCLVSARLAGFYSGLVLPLTEVHQFCDWWFRLRRYFYQILVSFNGQPERVFNTHDSDLFALWAE